MNFGSGVFTGDIFGFILALPIALFLTFWLSSVKNRIAVVIGAFVGALIGFIGIFGWASTLSNTNGVVIFFSSIFICSVLALSLGMLTDVIVARRNARDYRRQAHQE